MIYRSFWYHVHVGYAKLMFIRPGKIDARTNLQIWDIALVIVLLVVGILVLLAVLEDDCNNFLCF